MSSRFSEAYILHYGGATGVEQVPPALLDGGAGQLGQGQTSQAAIAGSFITVPVWMKDLDAWAVQFSTPASSTLVGTLTLQVSSDRSNAEQTGQPDATVVNWVTINLWDWSAGAGAASKAVASGAQSFMIGDRVVGYRWMRMNFAITSGAGLVKATVQQKGVS